MAIRWRKAFHGLSCFFWWYGIRIRSRREVCCVLMSSLSITPSGCGLCEACVSQISLRRVGTCPQGFHICLSNFIFSLFLVSKWINAHERMHPLTSQYWLPTKKKTKKNNRHLCQFFLLFFFFFFWGSIKITHPFITFYVNILSFF